MIFKGTIGSSGATVTALPTSGYSAGWTYRVITAGTYAGNVCEIGDLIIAVNDGPASGTSVVNADWTVAQTNIDGAITSGGLTANTVILGNGTSSIKSLTNGSNGQVLKLVSGVPAWSTDTDTNTWRAINVNGAALLASTSYTALNIASSTGISLATSGGTVTITNSSPLSATKVLTISGVNSSGTALDTSFNPNSNAVSISANNGLKIVNTSTTSVIGHTNAVTA
jgi:hypothetical protein